MDKGTIYQHQSLSIKEINEVLPVIQMLIDEAMFSIGGFRWFLFFYE